MPTITGEKASYLPELCPIIWTIIYDWGRFSGDSYLLAYLPLMVLEGKHFQIHGGFKTIWQADEEATRGGRWPGKQALPSCGERAGEQGWIFLAETQAENQWTDVPVCLNVSLLHSEMYLFGSKQNRSLREIGRTSKSAMTCAKQRQPG